jgi:hypothetical protein
MERVASLFEVYEENYRVRWVSHDGGYSWMWLRSYFYAFGPADTTEIGEVCLDYGILRKDFLEQAKITAQEFYARGGLWETFSATEGPPDYPVRPVKFATAQGKEFVRFQDYQHSLLV